MNNKQNNYDDLALGYLQGSLSDEDKKTVQQLIISDGDFLKILKEEIGIQKELQKLKQTLPPSIMQRVYGNITTNPLDSLYNQVLDLVFRSTIPQVARPVFKLLQRGVS